MSKNQNKLSAAEQKTTATFKLMGERIKSLETSLKNTQDQLETYREKYHAADKDNAVKDGKNQTLIFHEILKFVSSTILGAIGVNLITMEMYDYGLILLVGAIVLYGFIVWTDRR